MLDEKSLALLNGLKADSVANGYKIYSIEELKALTSYAGVTDEDIIECISSLRIGEYISVKYQDQTEVCLSVLAKGRAECENAILKETSTPVAVKNQKEAFTGAFLGAVLGGVIAVLLAVIIILVLGGK